MKEKMMKLFAFVLCAILVSMNCAAPAAALEKEVAPGIQSEEEENAVPYAEYISYYSTAAPAGTTASDFKAYVGKKSGSVFWEGKAINLAIGAIKDIVSYSVAGVEGLVISGALKPFEELKTAIAKYAPDSTAMTYEKLTYKNDKLSTSTSIYYKHVITYTLESGNKVQVTIYETASWV